METKTLLKLGVNPHRIYRTIPLGGIMVLTPYNGPPLHPRFAVEGNGMHTFTYCSLFG